MQRLPPAQRFEDLLVWQKSHQLVLRVYKLTATYPKETEREAIDEVARLLGAYVRTLLSPTS